MKKKALIIREIFKGDHNAAAAAAAAAAAVGRTRVKTNKRPFQGTLNYKKNHLLPEENKPLKKWHFST